MRWTIGAILLLFAGLAAGLVAQTTPLGSETVTLPAELTALMEVIAQRNTLQSEPMKPWRAVIHVDQLDEQGQVKSSSSVEEIWAGAHRYKRSYQTADHTWQIYGAEPVAMIVGEMSQDDTLFRAMREMLAPLPNEKNRAGWILAEKDLAAGAAKLKCLSVVGYESNGEKRPGNGVSYCIEAETPKLRVVTYASTQTQIVRNNIRVFQGKYVPGQLEEMRNGKTVWKAKLEILEELPAVEEAALAPPAEAKPLARKIRIGQEVAQGALIYQVKPVYPQEAKRDHIRGTVVLTGTIDKDGSIMNLHAISGPAILQQAAVDAVKQWKYRPYLLEGEPVAVETTMNVTFNLYP